MICIYILGHPIIKLQTKIIVLNFPLKLSGVRSDLTLTLTGPGLDNTLKTLKFHPKERSRRLVCMYDRDS